MTDPIDNPQNNLDWEPTADPSTGVDGGFGGQFSDYTEYKLFNGAFRNGPPDPSQNIDVASSTSGSNFMPNWRFIQSSNTVITAKQVRDTASPSGSNIRFTFPSGALGDEAYLEQIVTIGGDRDGDFPDHVRAFVIAGAGNTGAFACSLALQYLTVDGSIAGMPPEQVASQFTNLAAGTTNSAETDATNTGIAPTNARLLRIRLIPHRPGATANSATGTLDVPTVRRTRGVSKQVFTTGGTWYKPAGAQWVQVTVIGAGGGGGSGRRGAAGTNRYGGGGGGGGAVAVALFAAADLPDTVTVGIGAGGAGGAAPTTDNTDGAIGGGGGTSSFFGYLQAEGGTGGSGGTATSGTGAPARLGMFDGATGGTSFTDASGGDGRYSAGGGAGALLNSANAAAAGGDGGVPLPLLNALVPAPAGGAGGNSGTAGSDPPAGAIGGSGSGGGGTNGSGANTAGGRGAGGGGGGGRLNGGKGKDGGAGGDGYVAVIAW